MPRIRNHSLFVSNSEKIAHASQKRKKSLTFFKIGPTIAHLTHNRKHRSSNQQKLSILHPAGRFHLHLYSLRPTTIQPCTRFAGIPEAPYHSAFSKGFLFFFLRAADLCIFIFFFGSAALCCSAWRQHSPQLRPAGPATRDGAGRHGAIGHFVARCVCAITPL